MVGLRASCLALTAALAEVVCLAAAGTPVRGAADTPGIMRRAALASVSLEVPAAQAALAASAGSQRPAGHPTAAVAAALLQVVVGGRADGALQATRVEGTADGTRRGGHAGGGGDAGGGAVAAHADERVAGDAEAEEKADAVEKEDADEDALSGGQAAGEDGEAISHTVPDQSFEDAELGYLAARAQAQAQPQAQAQAGVPERTGGGAPSLEAPALPAPARGSPSPPPTRGAPTRAMEKTHARQTTKREASKEQKFTNVAPERRGEPRKHREPHAPDGDATYTRKSSSKVRHYATNNRGEDKVLQHRSTKMITRYVTGAGSERASAVAQGEGAASVSRSKKVVHKYKQTKANALPESSTYPTTSPDATADDHTDVISYGVCFILLVALIIIAWWLKSSLPPPALIADAAYIQEQLKKKSTKPMPPPDAKKGNRHVHDDGERMYLRVLKDCVPKQGFTGYLEVKKGESLILIEKGEGLDAGWAYCENPDTWEEGWVQENMVSRDKTKGNQSEIVSARKKEELDEFGEVVGGDDEN